MQTLPIFTLRRIGLRIFLLAMIVSGFAALLFTSQVPTAEAAMTVTLQLGQQVVVLPNGCNLSVQSASASKVKVTCIAWTPTFTPVPTLTPGPNESVLSFISEPGDYIGGGQRQRYTAGDSTFTAALDNDRRHISISVIQGAYTHWWYLQLAAPEGSELVPGTYENATRYPFQDASVPGLSFYGDGRGCNTLTGKFQVLDAVYSPDNYVERFHAKFEQHCEGGTAALFGEVQIVNAPPTATPTATETTVFIPPPQNAKNEAASREIQTAPVGKRTLSAGQTLKVLANGCKLNVTRKSISRVAIVCQALPTPTPTKGSPTATPTSGPTSPPMATVYVRNNTGGQLCYEIKGTGIGNKCFGGGDSLYGTFPAGTYSWTASAICGTNNGTTTFGAGTWLVTFSCANASLHSQQDSVKPGDQKIFAPFAR